MSTELTTRQINKILKSDPVLQNLRAKSRKVRTEALVLQHTQKVKLPRLIGKNNVKSWEIEKAWQARIKKLGINNEH